MQHVESFNDSSARGVEELYRELRLFRVAPVVRSSTGAGVAAGVAKNLGADDAGTGRGWMVIRVFFFDFCDLFRG